MAALLELRGVSVTAQGEKGSVPLLADLSLSVMEGEILSVIGETGAGKSMLIRTILNLLPRNVHRNAGAVVWKNRELTAAGPQEWSGLRGKKIGYVPQNAGAALNPLFRLRHFADDIYRGPQPGNRRERSQHFRKTFTSVGLPQPDLLERYPFQLSGGMQQRFLIGLALLNRPELILADEPTSALDLPVQTQILSLLLHLRDHYDIAMIYVTHDLLAAAAISDRIAVLRSGRLLQIAPIRELFSRPAHPYVAKLVSAAREMGPAPPDAAGE